jgi:hypothetical protein
MTNDEFDRQLRAVAHRALHEMSITAHVNAPPWEPTRQPNRRPWRLRLGSPLALAAGLAAAIALAAPLLMAHGLRGGTAGQNQPPEVSKPADVILADVTTAMSHLRSFHMVEHGTANDGSPVVIELRMDRVGSAVESWTMGGQTDTLVVWHGDLFVKGPHVVPASLQNVVGNHWLGAKASDVAPTLVATISPARIIACFTGDHGTLTKNGEHTVDGQSSIRLVSSAISSEAVAYTLDVALSGTPYALHYETDAGPSSRPDCQGPANPSSTVPTTPNEGSTGHEVVDFDAFDTADLVTPPSDYIDASAFATPAP